MAQIRNKPYLAFQLALALPGQPVLLDLLDLLGHLGPKDPKDPPDQEVNDDGNILFSY